MRWWVLLALAATNSLQAAAPNYEDHIRPIFENACFNCHNPDKQKGDLDLTTYSAAMRGGSGGKFAEPGEGGDSKIYGVITHTIKPKMPPKGDKLEKKEAELIRAWIDGGLLENKSGKARKKKKPAFALNAAPSVGKPDGPPPMPEHVLLEPVVTSARASVVADMVASPWAPLLAITGQRQVVLYNTDTLEMVGIFPFDAGQPEVLSFHPSGKYLLAGGGIGGKSGTTVTWEIKTGKTIIKAGKDFDAVLAASLRPDLRGVSLGGPGKRVKLWDAAIDEQLVSIKKHTDWVTQLTYSPDGVLLASGGRGGGVHIWEADTGNAFHNLRGHKAAITGMAWRSDSNLLATVSEDGEMIIWEMNNGKQVKKQGAHKGGALSVDWNHNGQLVTSGRDKKVKIWQADFKLLKELPGFSEMITEVSFSHDGKRVFAADWDGSITAWDVSTAEEVGILAVNPPTIGARIESIQEEILRFGCELNAVEKTTQAATAQRETAKTTLAKAEGEHADAVCKGELMVAERSKLEAEINAMNPEGEALNKQRQQRQHELTRARDELNEHNAELAQKRREHQQKQKEVGKLIDQERRLVDAEKKARKAAEKKTDDEKLAQKLADAVAKAQAELAAHREKLVKQRKLSEDRRLAVMRISEEQKGPGNQLAIAEKAWKEINDKMSAYHARRKELNDKRNALGKPISEQQKLAREFEKQIKPARKAHAKVEAAQKKALAELEQARKKHAELGARVKHWQAAAINAAAIELSQQAAALAAMQNNNMDAFSNLAAEIGQIKDPAKLTAKSHQLGQLRKAIDQAAPVLLEKLRNAREKKMQYRQASIQ